MVLIAYLFYFEAVIYLYYYVYVVYFVFLALGPMRQIQAKDARGIVRISYLVTEYSNMVKRQCFVVLTNHILIWCTILQLTSM